MLSICSNVKVKRLVKHKRSGDVTDPRHRFMLAVCLREIKCEVGQSSHFTALSTVFTCYSYSYLSTSLSVERGGWMEGRGERGAS